LKKTSLIFKVYNKIVFLLLFTRWSENQRRKTLRPVAAHSQERRNFVSFKLIARWNRTM